NALAAPRHAGRAQRRLSGACAPERAQRPVRLAHGLRRRSAAARLPAPALERSRARPGRAPDDALVYGVRDRDRSARAAAPRHVPRRESGVLPDAALLRRERAAERAPDLDGDDRADAAADAR